jgi:hypothetical protein
MTDEIRKILLEICVYALSALAPVMLVYLRRVARKLATMVEVELSDQQWRDVDATLDLAVRRAEEFARKALKHGGPAQSSEKLQVAIETARRVSPESMRYYDDDTVREMIEAKLHAIRPSLSPPAA